VGTSGEQVVTDLSATMGGALSGPSLGWLFRASLASCCATVIAMRAALLGINLTRLEIGVESESDAREMLCHDDRISAGASGLRTDIQIAADNADAKPLEELVQWADNHAPVGCTVRNAVANAIAVRVV